MTHGTEVDIRSASHEQAPRTCLARFDALGPGESLVVMTQNAPRSLLEEFQRERPNLFDWYPLEELPGIHRVQITRRASAEERHLDEFLEADHHRLDTLLAEVQILAQQHLFEAARRRFAELRHGMDRHITMEERYVLPLLLDLGGGAEQRVRLLGEHKVLRRLMDDVAWVMRHGDPIRTVSQVSDMTEVLGVHCMREREALYPALRSLRAQQSAQLVRTLQGL